MRTFHAKGVTIQVSTADLAKTTTAASSPATSGEIEQIARAFVEGSQNGTLFGTALSRDSENEDQGMLFLGEDDPIPFYMVHVGKEFFNIKATQDRSIRPKRMLDNSESSSQHIETIKLEGTNPPQQPHAVSLNVFLSPESFQPYMKSRLAPDKQDDLRDIKIDVYFNGTFLSSRVVAKKYAGDEFLNKELIVRFTGFPLSEQSEQALIFVPPGQNPDGSLRANKRRKETALQRWQEISERLKGEVQMLSLSDESAILANGVRELSGVTMPKDVERMRTNQRIFSTLDVFVTSGNLNVTETASLSPPFRGKTTDILSSGGPSRRSRLTPGYAYTNAPRKKTAEEQFQELEREAQLAIGGVASNKETKTAPAVGQRGHNFRSAAAEVFPRGKEQSADPSYISSTLPSLDTPSNLQARGSKRKHSPTPTRRVLSNPKTDERAREESPSTTTPSVPAIGAQHDRLNEGAALTTDNYFRPLGEEPTAPAGFQDDVVIGVVRCIFY